MPKVKLISSRVVYLPDDPRRFVSQPAGTVIECDDKEAASLLHCGQAEPVAAAEKKAAEAKAAAEAKKKAAEKTAEEQSDLEQLGLSSDQLGTLTSEDLDSDVPAFERISGLILWTETEGNSLSDKKGIGPATENAILEAIAQWIEAQSQ